MRHCLLKSNMADFEFLENFGKTPLPPYIKTKDPDKFHERYQSIFASNPGAVAAPTASLHFTDKIFFSTFKSKKYRNIICYPTYWLRNV